MPEQMNNNEVKQESKSIADGTAVGVAAGAREALISDVISAGRMGAKAAQAVGEAIALGAANVSSAVKLQKAGEAVATGVATAAGESIHESTQLNSTISNAAKGGVEAGAKVLNKLKDGSKGEPKNEINSAGEALGRAAGKAMNSSKAEGSSSSKNSTDAELPGLKTLENAKRGVSGGGKVLEHIDKEFHNKVLEGMGDHSIGKCPDFMREGTLKKVEEMKRDNQQHEQMKKLPNLIIEEKKHEK